MFDLGGRQPVEEQLTFSGDPLLMSRISMSVFEQDEKWRDSRGYTWKIEEMETSHLDNLIAFLERNAERFHEKVMVRSIVFPERSGTSTLVPLIPLEWLKATPLYKGIEAELGKRYPYNG